VIRSIERRSLAGPDRSSGSFDPSANGGRSSQPERATEGVIERATEGVIERATEGVIERVTEGVTERGPRV
jgi:hypothetical protein